MRRTPVLRRSRSGGYTSRNLGRKEGFLGMLMVAVLMWFVVTLYVVETLPQADRHMTTTSSAVPSSPTKVPSGSLEVYVIKLRKGGKSLSTANLPMRTHVSQVTGIHRDHLKTMMKEEKVLFGDFQAGFFWGYYHSVKFSQLGEYKNIENIVSHLECIRRAYNDGLQSVIIVEDTTVSKLSNFLLNLQEQQVDTGPYGWSVLLLTSDKDALPVRQGPNLVDAFISWLPETSSTGAYYISRVGMERILNQTLEGEQWRLPYPEMLENGKFLFSTAVDSYVSTTPYFESKTLTRKIPIDNRAVPKSIFVYTTARVKTTKDIENEIVRLHEDVDTLCKIHYQCFWAMHMVATDEALLPQIRQKAKRLPKRNVEIYGHFSTERFNKFSFLNPHVMHIKTFDYFLLKDNDQRIAGLPWRTFMKKTEDSVISAPVRTAPGKQTRKWSRQWFRFHDANEWFKESWSAKMFIDVKPVQVEFIEEYFALFDGTFAAMFFQEILTPEFTKQQVDWGADEMWCGAAQKLLPNRKSCSIIPVISLHEDSRQIVRSTEFRNQGREVVERFRENPTFDQWYTSSDQWRTVIGNASFSILKDRCQEVTNQEIPACQTLRAAMAS